MPGRTFDSNIRANSTAMPILPTGLTNATNAAAISHQFTATVHGTRCRARATLFPSASQVTHCSAASAANGSDKTVCVT